jgi:hypothetical protein
MFKSDSTVYSLTSKNLLSSNFSYLLKKISSPDYPITYLIQKSSGTLMLNHRLSITLSNRFMLKICGLTHVLYSQRERIYSL